MEICRSFLERENKKMKKKKSSIIYMAMCLKESADVQIGNMQQTLKMNWSDGMIGVLPVFDTAENARKYAGDKIQIIAIAKS